MANTRLLFRGTVLLAISASVGWFLFCPENMTGKKGSSFGWIVDLLGGVIILLSLLTGVILLFISTQRISRHYSAIDGIRHFIVKYYGCYIGRKMLRRFYECCKDPRRQQEALLREIVEQNKRTVYGRQFHLESIESLADFRKRHPITEYDHYKTFVDRIAKGEKNVMTTRKVSRLVLTSGTTGKSKRIPQDEHLPYRATAMEEALLLKFFADLHPMQSKLRYHCNFQSRRSEGGISMSAATALEQHMTRNMVIYTSPPTAFLIGTEYEASYIHLLFALRDKNVGSIRVTYISLFVDIMKFLEANWQMIVEDLEKGSLNPDLKLSGDLRRSLNKALAPGDTQRAKEVRKEFKKSFDGILKRLWPNLVIVSTIDNIGLRETVKTSVARGVEVYSPLYISSETLLGLNLWPSSERDTEYVLHLADNVFEFIHEKDMDKASPKTFLVDEVEVGQRYEIVLTQNYGLYRYRLGDVVEIAGFYQNCPKVKVLYRKATLLNLVGEKVDQTVISDSIKAALSPWEDKVDLLHYCVSESTFLKGLYQDSREEYDRTELFYIFFLEFITKRYGVWPKDLLPHTLSKELSHYFDVTAEKSKTYKEVVDAFMSGANIKRHEEIDKNISERHKSFKNNRGIKRISRPIVYIVEAGSFSRVREFILANSSASRTQFKMPLKLRTREMGELLLNHLKM